MKKERKRKKGMKERRRKGRKEGRKERRKEERKEGRKEGRKKEGKKERKKQRNKERRKEKVLRQCSTTQCKSANNLRKKILTSVHAQQLQQGDNSMEIFWLFKMASASPIQHF
jgi:hypothetical protein